MRELATKVKISLLSKFTSTLGIVVTIIVGGTMVTIFHLWASKELHGWSDLPDAINHAGFTWFMLAIGWICFKSPFASRILEYTQSAKNAAGEEQSSTIRITEPVAPVPVPAPVTSPSPSPSPSPPSDR